MAKFLVSLPAHEFEADTYEDAVLQAVERVKTQYGHIGWKVSTIESSGCRVQTTTTTVHLDSQDH